ncbi:MAG: M24 family metallopeptidase [Anaerolineales bacterium]
MNSYKLDALLLQTSGNFAWATCGGLSFIDRATTSGVASLLITKTDRYVVTNNIEAPRIAGEEKLDGQGWNYQVAPWYQQNNLVSKLTEGMRLGADGSLPNAVDMSIEIARLRSQLTPEEGARYRVLGSLCAQAMQQTIGAVRPGMTEYEIGSLLSQAAESKGVQATVILIATDERIFSYRHPLPAPKKLEKYAMVILCGRMGGLICSITRLVYFGKLTDEIRRKSEAVARIDAEMIVATRPGSTLGEVFRKAQEVYASVGFADEWQLHHQGGSAGYAPREFTATPTSTERIFAGQAFAWNPSITGSKSEDTILIGEHSNEIITEIAGWPTIDIKVGEQVIKRPAILER